MDWISVDNSMPGDEYVLAGGIHEGAWVCFVATWGPVVEPDSEEQVGVYWVTDENGCSIATEITHWQPLPEPPIRRNKAQTRLK